MTLGTPCYVRVETPRAAFARTMSEMRTWLDAHKIQPSDFKIVPTEAGIAVESQQKPMLPLFMAPLAQGRDDSVGQ